MKKILGLIIAFGLVIVANTYGDMAPDYEGMRLPPLQYSKNIWVKIGIFYLPGLFFVGGPVVAFLLNYKSKNKRRILWGMVDALLACVNLAVVLTYGSDGEVPFCVVCLGLTLGCGIIQFVTGLLYKDKKEELSGIVIVGGLFVFLLLAALDTVLI